MKKIHPYPVLVDEVGLEVSRVLLDDIAVQFSQISPRERTIALNGAGRKTWRSATLEVRVRPPVSEIDAGPWKDVRCGVLLTDRRTRVRDHFPITRSAEGTWNGVVNLHADRHVGRAELVAQVVATVDGVEGRVISAHSLPWIVDVEAGTPERKTARVEWTDIGESETPHLREYRNDPWVIDPSGEEPVIRLNSRFEGLARLLNSRRVADRSARDMIAAEIARDTWTVLFDAAVHEVERDEEGNIVWPGGWREEVLRAMLPHVLPEYPPEDAIAELSGPGGDAMRSGPRLVHAAATLAGRNTHLGRFVRTLSKQAQEE